MRDESQPQQHFRVSMLDVATLLYAIHQGSQHADVGFEDADRTLKQLTYVLSQRFFQVKKEELESALWSANLLDELGEFWEPNDQTFKSFVARILREGGHQGAKFDRHYNQIKLPPQTGALTKK